MASSAGLFFPDSQASTDFLKTPTALANASLLNPLRFRASVSRVRLNALRSSELSDLNGNLRTLAPIVVSRIWIIWIVGIDIAHIKRDGWKDDAITPLVDVSIIRHVKRARQFTTKLPLLKVFVYQENPQRAARLV